MANISPGKFPGIPPSILNTRPALHPPAGVKSNFVNPEDRGDISNAVLTVLFCLMGCIFANRIYTKLFIVRKTSWDDCECASKRVERFLMKLIFLHSNMHHCVCRDSLAASTGCIASLTAYRLVRLPCTSPLFGVMRRSILGFPRDAFLTLHLQAPYEVRLGNINGMSEKSTPSAVTLSL